MALREQFLWVEKYRPQTIEQCILPERIKSVFQRFVEDSAIPNLLLTGKPGTGKTTVARAMCQQIGADTLFVNASDENSIDILRGKIKSFASSVSFTGGRKYVILDEADYLSNAAQPALRGIMEEFASNCGWIFSCNYDAKIIDALQSRCTLVRFDIRKDEKKELAKAFFLRCQEILKAEDATCEAKLLSEVVLRYFPDFRKTLNALQGSVVGGAVSLGVLGKTHTEAYADLWAGLRAKDFQKIRTWIGIHDDLMDADLFHVISEWCIEHAAPESLPTAIVVLADYQYKFAFVADKQLHITACCVELMGDITFR